MTLTARILAQGDEICTGATLDTNSHWLAGELSARGVRVVGFAAAPDDVDALVALFDRAGAACDLLISTGGLGPTDDDLSARAAARAAGVEQAEHAEARAQIEAFYARLGRPMPPVNLRQAHLPDGATVLENPVGTAPGFRCRIGRAEAFFFPGVPRELRVMAGQHLWPWLVERGLAPLQRRRLHVCGVGESSLQERLAGLELPEGVRLGYKTWLPYNSIVLYGSESTTLDRAADAVRGRLGIDCFGADEVTFPLALGAALQARGWNLALAESCTAGAAGALVTEAPGSSAWFVGGVTSYSNAVKQDVLGVPAAILETEGAVSEACAAAMAAGVRQRLGADVGLAITGIAGPEGGTAEKPVGTVCFGLHTPEVQATRTVAFGDRGRDLVRSLASAAALEWLRRRLVASD